MSEQKIQVVCHSDLDGVCSYLVLCWFYNKKFDVLPTTPHKLQQDVTNLLTPDSNFAKLIFLDLDVSKIGDIIDNENTIIFDHHKTNIYPFKKAKTRIYNETSCCKLIYDSLFKNTEKQITSQQKTLIALADDWDSNTRATPLSEHLNIVYHSMADKFNSFVEDYYRGFKTFNKFEQNTILLYKKHKEDYLKTLNPFVGNIDFLEQQNVKVGAVFCNKYVQECCDFLLSKYKVDVAIAVLIEQKRIVVRRSNLNNSLDVSKFVQRIASGGGHEAAAGGHLTEEFIEFTKLLKPLTV